LKKTSSSLREQHNPTCWIEKSEPYLSQSSLAGVDEVGRGPLAGPVIAAACLFTGPVDIQSKIFDSKKLSPQKRAFAVSDLMAHPHVYVGFGEVSPEEIDRINILQATLKAMALAVGALPKTPSFVFVDGIHYPPIDLPGCPLVKGDSRCRLIAAASILAKEHRDAQMRAYAEKYPGYGFENHMGYGTQEHIKALRKFGPCPIHRRSFAPVAKLLQQVSRFVK
jgi:ribonuclease HII